MREMYQEKYWGLSVEMQYDFLVHLIEEMWRVFPINDVAHDQKRESIENCLTWIIAMSRMNRPRINLDSSGRMRLESNLLSFPYINDERIERWYERLAHAVVNALISAEHHFTQNDEHERVRMRNVYMEFALDNAHCAFRDQGILDRLISQFEAIPTDSVNTRLAEF